MAAGDHDAGAFGGEAPGDDLPHVVLTGGTKNDRNLAIQTTRHVCSTVL